MTRKATIRKINGRWRVFYHDGTVDHTFDIDWESFPRALHQALVFVGLAR